MEKKFVTLFRNMDKKIPQADKAYVLSAWGKVFGYSVMLSAYTEMEPFAPHPIRWPSCNFIVQPFPFDVVSPYPLLNVNHPDPVCILCQTPERREHLPALPGRCFLFVPPESSL